MMEAPRGDAWVLLTLASYTVASLTQVPICVASTCWLSLRRKREDELSMIHILDFKFRLEMVTQKLGEGVAVHWSDEPIVRAVAP
jgi:hypothetical protein